MSSCQVCDQAVGAEAAVVRCNGRCQRRVHASCAKTVGVMLAANGGIDLYWFCDGCRRGLSAVPKDSAGDSGPLLDTLRNLKRRMATMDDSLVKIRRSLGEGAAGLPNPDLPELPVEIWTEIFKEMSASQVLPLRLVCRRWKGIVDGSSALKTKFTATFSDLAIDGDYRPEHLLPVSKVYFQGVKVRTVGPWWKTFGPGLTEIQFGLYCRINNPILMDLLKHVPNLAKLKLDLTMCCATNDENLDVVPNFKLTKVKELTITGIGDESFDDILKLCCNLKSLSLDFNHSAPLETARTVASLHKTLEELHINPTDEFLLELMKLDRLKLKKLTLAGNEIRDINIFIEFCKMQPNLEYLDVQESLDGSDEAGFVDIVQLVPKLKSLAICLGSDPQIELKFLSRLTQLQSLNLSGLYDDYLCFFIPCELPGLRQLQLRDITFRDNSLQQWLTNVPNLRSITIEQCDFDCWSDLLEALESQKLLGHLIIKITGKISEAPCYYHSEFNALKSLRLEGCEMSPDMLERLLGLCPGLREFCAENVSFNNAALGIVCRQLRQLNQLIFVRCQLPKNAESYVREHCRELKELKICGGLLASNID